MWKGKKIQKSKDQYYKMNTFDITENILFLWVRIRIPTHDSYKIYLFIKLIGYYRKTIIKFSNYESKTQIIGNIFMCRSI